MDSSQPTESSQPTKPRFRLDLEYMKTLDGILKLGVILVSIPGVISASISYNVAYVYYKYYASIAICITAHLLIFYVIRLVYHCKVRWYLLEAIYCGLMALLYFIGMICMFAAPLYAHYGNYGASVAAGILCIPVIGCFAFDSFKKLKAHRSGILGPGQDPNNPSSEEEGSGWFFCFIC